MNRPEMSRRIVGRAPVQAAVAGAFLLALAQASAGAAELNGYVREKGHGDVALSFTSQDYNQFWMGTTKVFDPMIGTVTTKSTTLWIDYGVTDRLTLVGNLPYIDTRSDGTGGFGQAAFQDLTLVGKYRFASTGSRVRSDFVGAFGIRTIASNYEIQNSVVDIGDGTADWLARFIYQVSWRRYYFSQMAGYDWRGGLAPDDIPLYTELGATWGPVTVNGLYSRLTARGGTDIGSGAPFPSNREEFSRVGAKVYWRVSERIGLTAMSFTVLSGRNTGDATGYSGGIIYRFSIDKGKHT